MGKDDVPIRARVKIACPQCNSPQSFKQREREKDGVAQIFIACTMCRWEKVIYSGTPHQVKLKKDIDKLRGKSMRGDPVRSLLSKRQKRLRDSI